MFTRLKKVVDRRTILVSSGAALVAPAVGLTDEGVAAQETTDAHPASASAFDGRLATSANLSDLEDKAAAFDNLQTSSPMPGFVPSSPNLIVEKAPVSILDMMADSTRQDVRDGTNTGDFSGYLQAQLDAMIKDGRGGSLPATPTALRLEAPVVASFPASGGSSLVSSFELIGRGMKLSRFSSHVAGAPAIRFTHQLAGSVNDPKEAGYVTSGYVEGVLLRGFAVTAGTAAPGGGISVENLYNPLIDAVECSGFYGAGLDITAYATPDIDTTSMPRIKRCRLTSNDHGLLIGAQTSGAMALSQGIVDHNWIMGNRKDGVRASGFSQLALLYNAIVNNGDNGGSNDRGGMHVWINGLHPQNLYMRGNEFGNGNRAFNLKLDGIINFHSHMDRWVTNAGALDFPTPVSIIMGDGESMCRNWKIDHPQLVCHPTVAHTFLRVASSATVADNGAILDPDYLQWGATGQVLIDEPSRVTVVQATSSRSARERPRSTVRKTISTSAPIILPLDEGGIFHVRIAARIANIGGILGGPGGLREGETVDVIIENRTADAIAVSWPPIVAAAGFTAPGPGKLITARLIYHAPIAKFIPLGGWSAEIVP